MEKAKTNEYSAAQKVEFNRRALHYLSGGKMVNPEEMKERIKKARKKVKPKDFRKSSSL